MRHCSVRSSARIRAPAASAAYRLPLHRVFIVGKELVAQWRHKFLERLDVGRADRVDGNEAEGVPAGAA